MVRLAAPVEPAARAKIGLAAEYVEALFGRDTVARPRADPFHECGIHNRLISRCYRWHVLARRLARMLVPYRLAENGPEILPLNDSGRVPEGANWVDVFQPSPEEDRATETFLGAALPTREETQEIEFSSRFYSEDGAVYMTASLLTGIDIGKPILTPFTIVVAGDRVVTLRYEDLRAFRQFLSRASKPGSGCQST